MQRSSQLQASSATPFIAGVASPGASARLGRGGAPLREFGELAALVSDPEATDVFVNGDAVWVDRGGGPVAEPGIRMTRDRVRALAVSLVAAGGRHVDEASPIVDVRLHDGIRVHAVLPPVASDGPQLSIRLPSTVSLDLDELAEAGSFDVVARREVERLVARRANLLITGAGGSGKTTLLAAMLASAPASDRIITIEDVAELRIRHPHVVSLESRQANLEGAGEVTLARLVRESLRMRPDRLVLGECRGAEIRELLSALNTGHDGGAGTLHANSLADVPARLEALGALAGLDPGALARQAVSALDAVLHLERVDGKRSIAAIGALRIDDDRLGIRDAG